jgi:hypothetical protein
VSQPAPNPRPEDGADDMATFLRIFARVMAVQLVTVALLWLLQSTYGR